MSARCSADGVLGEGGTLCFSPEALEIGGVYALGAKGGLSVNAFMSFRCNVRDVRLLVERLGLLSSSFCRDASRASSRAMSALDSSMRCFRRLVASVARRISDERELIKNRLYPEPRLRSDTYDAEFSGAIESTSWPSVTVEYNDSSASCGLAVPVKAGSGVQSLPPEGVFRSSELSAE